MVKTKPNSNKENEVVQIVKKNQRKKYTQIFLDILELACLSKEKLLVLLGTRYI